MSVVVGCAAECSACMSGTGHWPEGADNLIFRNVGHHLPQDIGTFQWASKNRTGAALPVGNSKTARDVTSQRYSNLSLGFVLS